MYESRKYSVENSVLKTLQETFPPISLVSYRAEYSKRQFIPTRAHVFPYISHTIYYWIEKSLSFAFFGDKGEKRINQPVQNIYPLQVANMFGKKYSKGTISRTLQTFIIYIAWCKLDKLETTPLRVLVSYAYLVFSQPPACLHQAM